MTVEIDRASVKLSKMDWDLVVEALDSYILTTNQVAALGNAKACQKLMDLSHVQGNLTGQLLGEGVEV